MNDDAHSALKKKLMPEFERKQMSHNLKCLVALQNFRKDPSLQNATDLHDNFISQLQTALNNSSDVDYSKTNNEKFNFAGSSTVGLKIHVRGFEPEFNKLREQTTSQPSQVGSTAELEWNIRPLVRSAADIERKIAAIVVNSLNSGADA